MTMKELTPRNKCGCLSWLAACTCSYIGLKADGITTELFTT
jgi:hypothetical protein